MQMKKAVSIVTLTVVVGLMTSMLSAHCQIPCGIFGDHTRFTILREHITTIEKSMNQINELSAEPGKNINQLVRWVNNKELHADEFTEIVTYYFLAQRIKIADPADDAAFADYQNKITTLHQMMVYAMKTKQGTDPANINKLNELVDAFEKMYFTPEELQHIKEHKN
jgi:nickel superoxide dismutase